MRFKLRCPGVFIFCITAIYVLFNFFWSPKIHFLDVQKPSCACHKCLTEGDPCFKELINSAPMPFLSRQSPTSEDAFNWWKHIYRERYNFTFYNTTVDEVLKMFSSVPVVQSSPDRCRTCAVVGNSGNLKGSHYGPLIDFHDIVIRMNRAPIKGYETDVGTKTTYHVMYPESASQLDNNTHLVFFPFKIYDLLWLLKRFSSGNNNPGKSQSIPNKDLVMILNPAFMKYVHESWLGYKGYYPSTGFLTVALSMYICDEISIFGFGADKDGNWNHYFEILRNKKLKTGSHPGKEEYQFIQQLHKKQIIRFFKEW